MIPAWAQAVVLGIVQGVTEFLPVSSSAHLVLVPYLLGWPAQGLAFDVALHIGTLGALLVAFRAELVAMVRGVLGLDRSPEGAVYRRLALLIVPATLPVVVVGFLSEDAVAETTASPFRTSLELLLTAAALVATELWRRRRQRRAGMAGTGDSVPPPAAVHGLEDAEPDAPMPAAERGLVVAEGRTWAGDWRAAGDSVAGAGANAPADTHAGARRGAVGRARGRTALPMGSDATDPAGRDLAALAPAQAMAAGVAQVAALLPGVSRSGVTIAGGVFAGLTREAATRFSFLLSIPALVGAMVLSIGDLAEVGGASGVELAAGIASAFLAGLWAIRLLVRLVARERLTGFAAYCVAASAVGLIGWAVLGPRGPA